MKNSTRTRFAATAAAVALGTSTVVAAPANAEAAPAGSVAPAVVQYEDGGGDGSLTGSLDSEFAQVGLVLIAGVAVSAGMAIAAGVGGGAIELPF